MFKHAKRLLVLFLFIGLCFNAHARNLNDPQILKGYWKLNSNALDYTGNGNNGTWSGDEAYSTTPWGKSCADFGGDDDYIDCGNVGSLTAPFTVSEWVYFGQLSQSDYDYGFYSGNANNAVSISRWGVAGDLNKLYCYIGSDKSPSTLYGPVLQGQEWQMITLVLNVSTPYIQLYINGKLSSIDQPVDALFTNGDVLFGEYVTNSHFLDGNLAEARIYNVALTGDEVNQLYQMTYPEAQAVKEPIDTLPDLSDSSLVGAWLNKGVSGTGDDLTGVHTTLINTADMEQTGAYFDGSALLDIDDVDDLDITDAVTLSAWAKVTSTSGTRTIANKRDNVYRLTFNSGTLIPIGQIHLNDPNTEPGLSFGTAVSLNEYAYLVLTYDKDAGADNMNCYLNGELVASDTQEGVLKITATDFFIGAYDEGGTSAFLGSIKDVRIYNEAKPADWIKAEYQKAVPDDSLVLHVLDGTKDLSRYNNPLVNSGATVGKVMDFTTGNYNITAPPGVINSDNGTICLWFNANSASNSTRIFSTNDSTGSLNEMRTYTSTEDSLLLYIGDGSDISLSVDIGAWTFNSWENICFTWEKSGSNTILKGYKNGQFMQSDNEEGFVIVPDTSFVIGDWGENWYDGKVSDMRVYNEAKSAGWVKDYYNKTKANY